MTGDFHAFLPRPPSPAVLVVRLSSLGDVILTTPVYAALKAARPGCRVSVLVKRAFADVFNNNPHVDEVLVFEKGGFWGWAREIRRRRFDLYVDLHDTPRSRLWGLMSGIPRRVRYDKQTGPRRFLVWFKKTKPSLKSSVVERYLGCLAELGLDISSRSPRLYVEEPKAAGDNLVGIAPGALHATKRWLPEGFARAADLVAEELRRRNGRPAPQSFEDGDLAGGLGRPVKVVLLGAPADRPAALEVLRFLRGPALNLVGKTTLPQMLSWLKRCSVLLTNDSGAMHAAAAMDVPLAAVFGSTVRELGFFPAGERSVVVQVEGLSCRPCSLHGRASCPLKHFHCMRDITAERVAKTAIELLEKQAQVGQ